MEVLKALATEENLKCYKTLHCPDKIQVQLFSFVRVFWNTEKKDRTKFLYNRMDAYLPGY